MKDHKAIRRQITDFLLEWINKEEHPRFAVMLEGEWGSGKTYFIKEFIKLPGLADQKIIYVSAFGHESLESLKTEIFFSAANFAEKTLHRGASLLGSVFKGVLRIDVNNDDKDDGQFSANFKGLNKLIEEATVRLDDAILIVDDLERSKIQHDPLFGFLNELTEHGQTRIILISNSSKVKRTKKAKYNSLKEKLVGQTLTIPSDYKNALSTFITEISNSEIREVLKTNEHLIEKLYQQSGYENLRALRQYIWSANQLLSTLNQKNRQRHEIVETLLIQLFVFLLEFKLSLSEFKLDLTNIQTESPSITTQNEWVVYPDILTSGDRHEGKKEVFKKYNLTGFDTVISVSNWIDFLQYGALSVDINENISERYKQTKKDPWEVLWRYSDLNLNKEEDQKLFTANLDKMRENLSEGKYLNPMEFLQVAGLLIHFSKNEAIETKPEEALLVLNDYIDQKLIKNMKFEMYKQTTFRVGFKNKAYYSEEAEEFQKLKSNLENKLEAWYSEWVSKNIGELLLGELAEDPWKFIGNVAPINRGQQQYLEQPILQYIDPEIFVKTWLSIDREDERRLVPTIEQRYSYRPELMEKEASWWHNVREILIHMIGEEAFLPRKSQIKGNLKQLDILLGNVAI